jgi:hypothetical protein
MRGTKKPVTSPIVFWLERTGQPSEKITVRDTERDYYLNAQPRNTPVDQVIAKRPKLIYYDPAPS